MISRQRWRLFLLVVQSIVVVLVLGKLTFNPPKPNNSTIHTITFPQNIPLSSWQQVSSQPLKDKLIPESEYFSGQNIGGQSYRYMRQDRSLTIEMRYLVNTNGDLRQFIKQYTGAISPFLYRNSEIGTHSMYSHHHHAYLTACINPKGKTTVGNDDFRNNRLRYTITPQRIASWFIGQNSLSDRRCLWTYFLLPLNNSLPEDVYPLLESAWLDWYRWWIQNYPPV